MHFVCGAGKRAMSGEGGGRSPHTPAPARTHPCCMLPQRYRKRVPFVCVVLYVLVKRVCVSSCVVLVRLCRFVGGLFLAWRAVLCVIVHVFCCGLCRSGTTTLHKPTQPTDTSTCDTNHSTLNKPPHVIETAALHHAPLGLLCRRLCITLRTSY